MSTTMPVTVRVDPPPRRRGTGMRSREALWSYLFLVPMALLFLGFTVWPILSSWYFSFFDWDGVGLPEQFIGLANFVQAWGSSQFWNAFVNSFLFSLGALFIELPLALLLALLLNSALLYGRNVYRLALFLPVVATTAVVAMVIAVLLSPVGGVVNEALLAVGLTDTPVNFLGNPDSALPTVIGMDIWKGFGMTLIYWLAALQTVPKELYEAARIDGAGLFDQLRHVTIPVMLPVAIVVILLTFQRSLNTFDLVQAATGGGPVFSTDVIPTFIYRWAFDPGLAAPEYGYACAVGVMFGLATLVVTLLQGPLLGNRMRRYSA